MFDSFDCYKMFDKLYVSDGGYTILNHKLADTYGVAKAIVISKVHYAVRTVKEGEEIYGDDWHFKDGRWWVSKSYAAWNAMIPYVDLKTIKRTFASLREAGVLISSSDYSTGPTDQALWWAVNYAQVFIDTKANVVGTKCPQGGRDKMSPSIDIYNIYIHISREYKDINNKESAYADQSITLRHLESLKGLDRSKLISLLAFTFIEYKDRFGVAHPRLPDNAKTVEVLDTLLGMIHEQGLDDAMNDYDIFLNASWIKGDRRLWLFCSEKIQAWLKAIKTDDYDSWVVATDRVAH